MKVTVLILLFLVALAKGKPLQRRQENSLVCLILEVHERTIVGDEHSFECDLLLDDGGMIHGLKIELPEAVVGPNRDSLRRGAWYLTLPGAQIHHTHIEGFGAAPSSIILPPNPMMITVPGDELRSSFRQSRRLTRRRNGTTRTVTETRTVLVIRVSTLDKSPTFDITQLNSYYFDAKNYSVARQYSQCSANWIQFKATSFVPRPVVDVLVPGRLASFTKETLWASAWNITLRQYNINSATAVAQHVAFILPPGLPGGYWVAAATTGYWRSIYNDIYGGYPNVAMHEFGHNLGMGHSGMGGNQYADTTDIMGYGDMQQFGPSRCFNGLHYWFLNWYTDRRVEVTNPWNHTRLTLAAFVDYSSTNSSQVVMIKVDTYYLVYNLAKGVNVGTEEAKNQVTVVEAMPGVMSTRLAALDNTTAPFSVLNYNGGSQPLVIQVCSMVAGPPVDYAVVSIGVGKTCSSL